MRAWHFDRAGVGLTLALLACPPPEPLGGSTGATSTGTSGGEPTTGDTQSTTAQPTGGGSSTTAGEPLCMCHSDCPEHLYCYPDGSCFIDPNDCGEAKIDIPIPPSDVVLVLDKSSSMGTVVWDGDADPNTPAVTRWNSLHGAVEGLVTTYERSLNFGVVLSPSNAATAEYTVAACPVEAAPEAPVAPMNAATLLAALPEAPAQVVGATPTRAALLAAVSHIEAQMDGLPRAIVLVTDGAANCSPEAVDEAARFEVYDDAVLEVVADAAAAGIRTFVVGLAVADTTSAKVQDGEPDATNLFERLNELALAGGAPQDDPLQRFHGASDQPGIEAALTSIAVALLPCTLTLDPVPYRPDYVDLSVAGVDYGRAADVAGCAGVDGWRYVDVEVGTVELCGQACADLRTAGSAEFYYRCAPPPEPPQCPSP